MTTYGNVEIIVHKKEGDVEALRIPHTYTPHPNDRVHIVKEGDRLDLLAHRYYRDSLKWYLIADANDLINPMKLEIGSSLIIPGKI